MAAKNLHILPKKYKKLFPSPPPVWIRSTYIRAEKR
jgi:hypothetical protein